MLWANNAAGLCFSALRGPATHTSLPNESMPVLLSWDLDQKLSQQVSLEVLEASAHLESLPRASLGIRGL